jgi:hypothetical protein
MSSLGGRGGVAVCCVAGLLLCIRVHHEVFNRTKTKRVLKENSSSRGTPSLPRGGHTRAQSKSKAKAKQAKAKETPYMTP